MNRQKQMIKFTANGGSALRESKGRYRTLFDLAPIAVYSCDASGVIREYNNRAAELWGRNPAPGDTDERFCGSFKMYRPDGSFMSHEECPMGDVLCGKVPGIHDGEVHIERPDGSRVIVIVNIAPLTDEQGDITGAINCFYDVTARKQAEQALRESEERYRDLYESIDEGFCVIQVVFDAKNTAVDYIFLEVNPSFEKQTGIPQARGKSMRAIALHHEEYWFEMFGEIALTGKSRRFEYPAAEFHRWYEGYAYRLGKAHERKVGILFNDITERKRAEEQLRQLNEELEARVTERTEELTDSQKRLRVLAAALNATEQRERQRVAVDLHDYLAQLLALTRIKLGLARRQPMQPPLANILTDVEEVTNKAMVYTRTLISQLSPPALSESGLPMALQWLTEQIRERDLSVTLHVKTQIPTIAEDQALLLFQSIRELLINCVKHAETHEAAVTLEQVDGSLYIQISDQGVGFNSRVFANKGDHSPAPGFGLLSIRERMLSLGGRFELESSPGKGTTTTLVLPLGDRAVESSVIASHGSIIEEARGQAHNRVQAPAMTTGQSRNIVEHFTSASGSTVRVLVADDHAMVRQGLCSVLKQYSDIQVVGEAANGEEAVALADSLQPDVILMDVTMPKVDGVEATRLLKRKHPDVVVIGLSIHTTGQVETAMTEAGAVAFVNKEAAVDELYQTIHTARQSTGSRLSQ
ncbi:MAG TPA: response regulator [Nitrospiraceae bacterium]|nr:response regulator [Nitrospiraceae bacterium]